MSASTSSNHLNLGLPSSRLPSGLVLNKPYFVSRVASFDLSGIRIRIWISEHLIFNGSGLLALGTTFTN
jgi:hypothetical protein